MWNHSRSRQKVRVKVPGSACSEILAAACVRPGCYVTRCDVGNFLTGKLRVT